MMRMIKAICLALLMALIPMGIANADKGFRDLTWGEDIESIKTRRVLESCSISINDQMIYRARFRENEDRCLMETPIEGYYFRFWNQQLTVIEIHFGKKTEGDLILDFFQLKDKIEARYGEKMIWRSKNECLLFLDDEIISLSKESSKHITLRLASMEMAEKIKAANNQKRLQAANQGW